MTANIRFFSLAFLSAIFSPVFSQTAAHGQADVTAGVGSATPYGANVKLDLASSRMKVHSFIGLTGITRKASAETDKTWYNYSRTDNFYQSVLKQERKGNEMNYGVNFQYEVSDFDTFTGSITGTSRKTEVFGTREESLIPVLLDKSDLSAPVRVNSKLYSPMSDAVAFNASASWQHRTKLPGESLSLTYNFGLNNTDCEQTQTVTEQENFSRFLLNQLHRETSRYEQSVQFEWKRPLASGQLLTAGARYNQWKILSYDQQLLDSAITLDEHFKHRTRVAAAYLGYNLVTAPLIVNARVEYDYTHQQQRDLHDVIPSLRMQLNLTSHQSLVGLYAMRLVRPEIEFLNPAHIVGAFTLDYGNPNLEGIHIHMMSLAYNLKQEDLSFAATVQHIRAEDGFNAIWMEKANIRESFYGNEGVRRAWSFTPELEWKTSEFTTLFLKGIVLWDKRIARAISMAKEHWGYTAQAKLQQKLPADFRLTAHYDYSEGNTIDLYSHESSSMTAGASLQRSFLPAKNLTFTLAYDYHEYAKAILTQGAYTGRVNICPDTRHAGSLTVSYKF